VEMRLSCNFVNVYTTAYRVHSPNPNPDSSNRISPYFTLDSIAGAARLDRDGDKRASNEETSRMNDRDGAMFCLHSHEHVRRPIVVYDTRLASGLQGWDGRGMG